MTRVLCIAGAIRWLAPELCFVPPQTSSFSSDVWAYGCVILEITTGDFPWIEQYPRHKALTQALADKRNAIIFQEICREQQAPAKLVKILSACCTWSKHNRPNFVDIIQKFHSTFDADFELSRGSRTTSKSSRARRNPSEVDVSSDDRSASAANIRKWNDSTRIKSLYSTDEDEEEGASASGQRYTYSSRKSGLRD